ncbi:MAG: HAD hydrolase-like protein [Rhodospirillales bacterium]|nr:HAD hydrolase-like protein [Rhodospirillales bacterium]
MRFQAISFDCYGTLIDWDTGIGLWLENWASLKGIAVQTHELLEDFARHQRAEQTRQPFQSYRMVLGNAFRNLGAQTGVETTDGEADEFAATAGTWPPFEDTVAALRELKRQGRVLAVISNVDNDLFTETRELLGEPFDIAITAEDVQGYKPEPPHFNALRAAITDRGIAEEALLHTARSRFHDIATANALGWSNCLVDRRHDKPGRGVGLPSDAVPTWTVTSMAGFINLLTEIDPV